MRAKIIAVAMKLDELLSDSDFNDTLSNGEDRVIDHALQILYAKAEEARTLVN